MRKFIVLFFFAVTMAYLEAAVVVYLRDLSYPEGFSFPLKAISSKRLLIELGREASTIIMLVTAGMAAGGSGWQQFSFFLFLFGVWDIFYYFWLKVMLDWPASLLSWDILFLIPMPWVGPVLSPMLVALTMSVAGMVIVAQEEKGLRFSLSKGEWLIEFLAGGIILLSFLLDAPMAMKGEVPTSYHWELLFLGLGLGLWGFFKALGRTKLQEAMSDEGRVIKRHELERDI